MSQENRQFKRKKGKRTTPLSSLERILCGELVSKGLTEKTKQRMPKVWRLATTGSGVGGTEARMGWPELGSWPH